MNKVKFGLRNVYYSKITLGEGDTYTYATPVAINGAVSLSLSPSGDTTEFFADDVIYYSDTANQGYEGDLEIALVPKSFKTDIMGMTEDINGALVENADDKFSPFALAFEVQGDDKGRRTWLYNCTVARPNQDAATKEKSVTPSKEKLTIKVMPRLSDRAVKASLELSTTNETAYNGFFSEVYEKTNASV